MLHETAVNKNISEQSQYIYSKPSHDACSLIQEQLVDLNNKNISIL